MTEASHPANDLALATLRRTHATSLELEKALAGIDLTAAEAAVDELEAQRRRLLAGNGSDRDIDLVEDKIKTANRTVERLAAARDELPGRIAARKAKEAALDRRIASAEKLMQRAMALFVEIDKHATKLAPLLEELRRIEGEVRATNLDVEDMGLFGRSVAYPLTKLARYLKCSTSELPDPSTWNLPGYVPTRPSDRQLGAARDLIDTKSNPASPKE